MNETPLRILLAEDDDLNRLVMRRVLERLGHQTDTVANGLDALAAALAGTYDVVVLDVQMPGMDGLEVARRIRSAHPVGSPPWLIAFTGHCAAADRAACFAAGVDDYLAKPVGSEDFVLALERSRALGGERTIEPAEGDVAASSPATGAPPLPLDRNRLDMLRELGRQAGQDLLAVLIRSYVEEAPRRLRAIEELLDAGDASQAGTITHGFKGISSNLGAVAMAVRLAELERCLGDRAAAKAQLAILTAELARTLAELRRIAP